MSQIVLRGRVTVYETPYERPVDPSLLRKLWEGDNHITDNGLLVFGALLAGGANNPTIASVAYDATTVNTLFVTTMKVGTSSSPAAPSHTDTGLAGAVAITLPTTAASAAGGITFSAVVPADQLQGTTLSEEGIFTASGIMVGRVLLNQVKSTLGVQIDHFVPIAFAT